jgi:hypothetical protein
MLRRRWLLSLCCGLLCSLTCGLSGCADQAVSRKPEPPQADPAGLERRVIETAMLELRVQNLSDLAAQVPQLVAESEGYIASSYLTHSVRTSRWTIRVPSANLSRFLNDCAELGTVVSQQSLAEDVTDQYIDVKARLATKRLEEERLQKLLTERTGDLSEVLNVERELSRVRGEIELAEGRQRYLEHQTTFATVELRATVKTPPAWSAQIPLPQQVASVLSESWSLLLAFLRGVLLIAVASLPWLWLLLIPFGLIWRYRRASPIFE